MIWWVIYDIAGNKTRSRAASACMNYGLKRVQKSAFLGELTKNRAEMLALEIKEIISPNDCVFLIPCCSNCFKDKIIYGEFDEEAVKKKDWYIVTGDNEG
ncbi:MAG: CRISPR-associated endonuclease Cas2 [Candidatus Hadarchaeales archaeon]